MKKILILIAIFTSFLFQACDVEVSNPNELTQTDFWQTEQDVYNGVNGIYNNFYRPETFTRWYWFRTDLAGDEGFSQSPWAALKEWTQFTYSDYDFYELNSGIYTNYYKSIYRANQVITYSQDVEMSDESRNEYLGQAYFLRAFYYYHLAVFWGGENNDALAIITEPSTPDEVPEGHPVSDVWALVEADLAKAITMLPEQWDSDQTGRCTKGAAHAMLAKALMQQHKYAEAIPHLDWLISGEGSQYYGLVPNYIDNFTHLNENNIESVFEIQYSDENGNPAEDGDYSLNPNLGCNRAQFFGGPTIGWNDGEARGWVVDEYKKETNLSGGNDIRLKYSLFYEGMADDFTDNENIYTLDQSIWTTNSSWTGRFFIRKYATDYYRDQEDYYSPVNIRYIRFADVLLLHAECLAQTGGSLSTAIAEVDRVRARVDMPGLAVNHPEATVSADAFLERLKMERVLELCYEGHRWEDLVRWGLNDQETIDEIADRDPDFNNFVVGKNNLLPLPTSEINNNPNLVQNAGY